MASKKLNKNLYQDSKSGIWYFQKKIRRINKPYKFSMETTSIIEARRKRDEYLLDIAVNGKITDRELPIENPEENKAFGEVAMLWVKINEKDFSKSTMEEYRKDMNNQILPHFGNRPISTITGLEIELFISQLKCSGKRKLNILTPFKNVMKFAKTHKMIVENPMDDVGRIKINDSSDSEKTPLSLNEIKIFLETVPEFYKPLFMLLFFTGVRIGEAAALKWKRVSFKDGEIHICKTLVRGEYKVPKTKESVRFVKLSPVTVKALKLQKEHTFGKSEFVFLNTLGRNLNSHSVNCHVFKTTLLKAGLPSNRSCKDTRTSYITGTIDNHERLSFVQKQVGHKTTQMIIKHYYKHIPASDDGKAFEKAFAETVAMKNLTSGDTK